MSVLGIDVPTWVLDWTGSILVVVSLWFLFEKRMAYWHWSNASLLPYFLLFLSGEQYMLAGLQVSYLVFGIHGLLLWRLEARRRAGGRDFDERAWYSAGWLLTLAIFSYTVVVTDFVDGWAGLQFVIVSLALIANWATTRQWTWSWIAWMAVNTLQSVYFAHLGLWAQFGLQFVLFAMSAHGLRAWRRAERPVAEEADVRVAA
jgi:nicotinamide mononucleotide transporter